MKVQIVSRLCDKENLVYTHWSNLVVKMLILSFRNPESAISSRVILNLDLHMGPSPKAFLINMPLDTLRSAFLLYLLCNCTQKIHPEQKPFSVKHASNLE